MTGSVAPPDPAGPVRNLVVVGGGVAGWSAAAILASRLSGAAPVDVCVLEEAADEPAALAALPTVHGFHARLALDEDRLIAAGRGGFRLGVRFRGFSGPDGDHIEPFGPLGAALGGAAFQHVLAAERAQGRPASPEAFSLAATAARLGRFARPSADPRSVLSTLAHGLQLDAAAYADALRAASVRRGARPVAGALAEVEVAGGRIAALRLATGERLTGDLYVDCTGPRARLLSALDPAFEAWGGLPFDRRLEALAPSEGPPAPFDTIVAHPAGWRSETALQGAVAHALVWAAEALDETAARERLAEAVGAGSAAAAPLREVRYGRRPRAWVANCVALGAAAGAVGPPDLDVHLAHSGAERLLRLLPTAGPAPMAAAEFNRLAAEELARLRDFAQVRLRLNGRRGEPLWDALRGEAGSEELEHKIRLFESRGRVPLYEGEIFPEDSWVAVLLAHGLWPRRQDFRVEAAPPGGLQDQLRRMQAAIEAAARAMPTHADVLNSLAGTPA